MAQGDGEVKRREDQRRQKQAPTCTLFVVNFDVANTRESDLAYTFEKFGPTKRVQIKKNFAFIQASARSMLKSESFKTRNVRPSRGGRLGRGAQGLYCHCPKVNQDSRCRRCRPLPSVLRIRALDTLEMTAAQWEIGGALDSASWEGAAECCWVAGPSALASRLCQSVTIS